MENITHQLKIDNCYLLRLLSGDKKSEIRFNDRDYQVGDFLSFSTDDKNMGRKFQSSLIFDGMYFYNFLITHIHSNLGLKDGFVVLSLEQKI